MIVVCVYKSGGRYKPFWAYQLKRWAQGYRFLCLSDENVPGVETIPLKHNWLGWWSKIEVFRPGLFDGPVLYIDLDSVIVGPLDGLFQHDFHMCKDFLNDDGRKNSSVMAWCGDYSHIYDAFRKAPKEMMRRYDKERPGGRIGDQAFIEDHVESGTFPEGQVVSYRKHARREIPKGAKIVTFHGEPKQDKADGWVAEWRKQ